MTALIHRASATNEPTACDAIAVDPRAVATMRPDDRLGEAIGHLKSGSSPCVAVVDADGRYVGLVTPRRIAQMMLPVRGGLPGSARALRFLGPGVDAVRRHLAALDALAARDGIDADVQAETGHPAIVTLLEAVGRGQAWIPIVERPHGRYLGVVLAHRLLGDVV